MAKKVKVKESGRQPKLEGLKPGSTLKRDYKGKTIEVQVKSDGFHFKGQRYTSLSKIASDITDASTNGPLWFGLRKKEKPAKAPKAAKKGGKAKAKKAPKAAAPAAPAAPREPVAA